MHNGAYTYFYNTASDTTKKLISGPSDDEIKAYSLIKKADIECREDDYWDEGYTEFRWHINLYAISKPSVDITIDVIGLAEDIPK